MSTSKIRCYEVHDTLIYKVNNDNFKYVGINAKNELNPAEYQSLVTVCNILVGQNEWKWIKACAKFLLNSGNTDIINRLQNYAKGQFTQEEM